MNKCIYTVLLTAVTLTLHAADRNASVTLNANAKYQHIDGFGGTAMTPDWRDAYTQQKVNLLWGNGEDQVGLNIMRIRINPNEGNWGEYGNPIRWARKINPNLQVFATPWTPPKKYKTHNTNKYQNDFGTWVWPLVEHSWGGEGSNGGAINPDCYDEYADFLERYRQTMEQKGCPIDMISIQNESDYTPTTTENGVEHASYESCIYSPTQMAAMVKTLRQHLDPKCKIMGPECFGWGEHTYNNKLVTMTAATANIDIWGNHLYGTNDWSFVQNVTRKTGRPMWETEFLIDYENGYDGNFTAEYPMIESIEKAMTSGYSAYVYYSMFTHFFASNHGGSANQLWKRAYVFSHYAKCATGMTRISSSVSNGNNVLKGGSAYISQNGDTITVMLLNTSKTDTYNVAVTLPFEPLCIMQTVTGEVANAKRTDVTDRFANGTKRPVVQLLPGNFYTFQFIKNATEKEDEVGTSLKQNSWSNPLWSNHFMADPTSIEYNGRLYVYATNDQQEYNLSHGLQQNSYSKITQLVCMSSADLVNWTMHDIIDVKAVAPWISTSWAPSIVSREEADGQTHFYLYFTNSAMGIGVLTSTSPTGPWTDPLGHALIDKQTPGLGAISQIIDPGAAISDDGQEAYLTFGGGDILTGCTDLQPGNARIVKLGADMVSLDGDIVPISAPCHFEANELNYISGKWYYSYCTRWTIASDWSSYSKKAAPGACSIVYMTSTKPLNDKWTYQGVIMPNPGTLGYPYGTNHSHLQRFGSGYYLLYHTQWLEQQMGANGGYRNLQLNSATVSPRTSNIATFTQATASLEGVEQPIDQRVNPYEVNDGNMSANATFSPAMKRADNTLHWWQVRGVDFSIAGFAPARSLQLNVCGTGTVQVHTFSLSSEPIATATFSCETPQTITVPLTEQQNTVQQYLYFIYTEGDDPQVLSWQFSNQTTEQIITPTSTPQSQHIYYNLNGQQVEAPVKGIYIRQGKKIVIR